MKHTLFLAATLCAAGLALAQGGDTLTLDAADVPAASGGLTFGSDDANAQMDAYLQSKGMQGGPNVKANGDTYVIAVGLGTILAPKDDPQYTASRVNAFDRAMLAAKAEMARNLEGIFETAMEMRAVAPDQLNLKDAQTAVAYQITQLPEDSLVGGLYRAMDKKLSEELAKQPGATPAEITDSASFRAFRQASAVAAVAGLQAYHTIEVIEGDKGTIAVAALWSPKLARLAESMVKGTKLAVGGAKKTVRAQLPTDAQTMLSTFGAKTMVDEQGELVLVSFGQSVARNENSALSERAAYSQARLAAETQIRSFAGEMVSFGATSENAELTFEFPGETGKLYENINSYQEFQESSAKAMTIRGISQLTTWKAKHPVSGRTVYGSICTWKPSSAALANDIRKAFGESAKRAALGDAGAPKPKAEPKAAAEGEKADEDNADEAKEGAGEGKAQPARLDRFINRGLQGDDDAF